MPLLTRIKQSIDRLAQGDLTEDERRELLHNLGELFVQQFNKTNNIAAVVIENEVLSLSNQLDTLSRELAVVKELVLARQNKLERTVTQRDTVVSDKMHALSNYMMILEDKLNSIVELLTSDDEETKDRITALENERSE